MSAIILFDGVCNLCNKAVQFIINHDHKNAFKFASLQSDFAAKYMDTIGLENTGPRSVVMMIDQKIYIKSDAVLQIAKQLKFPTNLLYGFIIVPRIIRDGIYEIIAKHRYRWFGRRAECMIPTPGLKSKFLD